VVTRVDLTKGITTCISDYTYLMKQRVFIDVCGAK